MVILLSKDEDAENAKKETVNQNSKTDQTPKPDPEKEKMAATVKEIEKALYAIKFYPVAVSEDSKNEALDKLESVYKKSNEPVRQLLLYMIHEILATVTDIKIMHTYEYFKVKNPNADPSQTRINVYRAIFNYNTSLEGIADIIRLVGRFSGSDDAAKLLTYHFTRLSNQEHEGNHMIRAIIIEALGKSESRYALNALLEYAKYSDSERTFNRVAGALVEWEEKLEGMKIKEGEKEKLRSKLQEVINRDIGGSHYG